MILGRIRRRSDKISGVRVFGQEIKEKFTAAAHDRIVLAKEIKVVRVKPSVPDVLTAPCPRAHEAAPRKSVSRRCEAPRIRYRVRDPAVHTVIHLCGVLSMPGEELYISKEHIAAFGQPRDLGQPVIHLNVYVDVVVSRPDRIIVVRPDALKIRREQAIPARRNHKIPAEIEVKLGKRIQLFGVAARCEFQPLSDRKSGIPSDIYDCPLHQLIHAGCRFAHHLVEIPSCGRVDRFLRFVERVDIKMSVGGVICLYADIKSALALLFYNSHRRGKIYTVIELPLHFYVFAAVPDHRVLAAIGEFRLERPVGADSPAETGIFFADKIFTSELCAVKLISDPGDSGRNVERADIIICIFAVMQLNEEVACGLIAAIRKILCRRRTRAAAALSAADEKSVR